MEKRLGSASSMVVLVICLGVVAVPALTQNNAAKHTQIKVKAPRNTETGSQKRGTVSRENPERVNRQEPAGGAVNGDCHAMEQRAHQLAAEERNLLEQAAAKKQEANALLQRSQEAERERLALLHTSMGKHRHQSPAAEEKERQRTEFHRQSDEIEKEREAVHRQADEVARQREAIEREHQQRCGRRIAYGENERPVRK
jgi:hypothetical protein